MRQRGFLFLEAALLGFFLVLLAGLALLPQQAARLEAWREARESAVFLAQQELAELEARRDVLRQSGETSFGWLGQERDLAARLVDYTVVGTVSPAEGGLALRTSVRWEIQGTAQELELTKWVVAHEAE